MIDYEEVHKVVLPRYRIRKSNKYLSKFYHLEGISDTFGKIVYFSKMGQDYHLFTHTINEARTGWCFKIDKDSMDKFKIEVRDAILSRNTYIPEGHTPTEIFLWIENYFLFILLSQIGESKETMIQLHPLIVFYLSELCLDSHSSALLFNIMGDEATPKELLGYYVYRYNDESSDRGSQNKSCPRYAQIKVGLMGKKYLWKPSDTKVLKRKKFTKSKTTSHQTIWHS